MDSKQLRKDKAAFIKRLKQDNPKMQVFQCEHVATNEQPARLNIYIGTNRRVLLCRICTRVAESTIADFQFANKGNNPIWRTYGRMEGARWLAAHVFRDSHLFDKAIDFLGWWKK